MGISIDFFMKTAKDSVKRRITEMTILDLAIVPTLLLTITLIGFAYGVAYTRSNPDEKQLAFPKPEWVYLTTASIFYVVLASTIFHGVGFKKGKEVRDIANSPVKREEQERYVYYPFYPNMSKTLRTHSLLK